ncbi:bifunctional phosphopantothenoylcysteine decarboxylase/phosphopantothenate--cysteine ligase CoaBC [Egicoccus halophilus]|uniref:Coenzyme A biosynthesis bifunctional protein CoaBC n=1 Tax=Egicoccus halophilus TaxID=1670830 RepID=A0A8J3AEY2_9ACTN|nr:bifunctional phosphopantothenoylcysteine decarboxylase/phosphopantothenate--cysteine ligase CoaBC [Egicoccus halophilus]GGI07447.1 phosphopantothenoylcysteine decarboxylase [Egicoccus halophilus]
MSDLRGTRVLLGVTGGIAAYKAALLARLLVGAGATVEPVLTRGARHFVGAATFEGITGRPVRDEVWTDIPDETHVALGRSADVAVVYPATANVLAKLAGGHADDLLTTTLLAATCPLVVAPAMHTEMWQHPATRANAEVLRARGVDVLGPAVGALMGGDAGAGRLVEPDEAFARVVAHATAAHRRRDDLAGVRVLVTAGGTREPIDPVRFLGNRSSGKMGFALAAAAAARGAEVQLVAAPTSLTTPPGVIRTDVTTALDMHAAVFDRVADVDVVVKAAAVADFRPVTAAGSKLKKSAGAPRLELVPNPDILADLGERRRGGHAQPLLVGFAAETDDVEAYGRDKLARKNADLLVVNDVGASDAGFGVDTNRVVILGRDGARTEVGLATKRAVAERILDAVVDLLPAGPASLG